MGVDHDRMNEEFSIRSCRQTEQVVNAARKAGLRIFYALDQVENAGNKLLSLPNSELTCREHIALD